ncbi:VTT domain-containing protein [Candidatus Pacearchaeota archaeon]|nr:VTT domain-containing protein [Candidatus Pacearchaeota archaeon]
MNKQKLKKFAKEVSIPIILLAIYFILFHVQKVVSLPAQDALIELTLDYINTRSIFFIFLIALVEGGLILGQYAPGGIVISLSIISAGGDVVKVILLCLVISLAYLVAYGIDYFIGYYGINRLIEKFGLYDRVSKYKRLLEKNVFTTIFFSYWETNIASIVAAAAGSLKVSFKKFFLYSVICVLFWVIFWAIILFFFGNIVLRILGYQYLLILVVIWISFIFYRNFLKKEEPPQESIIEKIEEKLT